MSRSPSLVIPFDLERARVIRTARRLERSADELLDRATGPDASRFLAADLTRKAVQLRLEAERVRGQLQQRTGGLR